MARITERNGKYKVVIELGKDNTGKRIRHTKEGFKTKKEARTYATVKENEMLSGMVPNNNKVLLKDFVTSWYQNYILKSNLAINSVNNLRIHIERHIIPFLGNMQLVEVKTIHVQNFYYSLLEKGLKPISCKRIITTLKKFFNYSIKMNIVNVNPCDIEYVKNTKENKINIWTESQLLHFLKCIKEDTIYLPVVIAAFTGMRIGEICGLRYENIDFDNLRINVCEQTINDKMNNVLIHTNILKTSKSNRTITIPKFLKDIILENKKSNDFVIVNSKGGKANPRNISMLFNKRVSWHNMPKISFHDLRHIHATILLLHGENIKVISERLGHESIQITLDTYSHVLPSMEMNTSKLLENLFSTKI